MSELRNNETSNLITSADRIRIKNHGPVVLWLTGLSGSGKTTLANAIEYRLNQEYRLHTYFLDGDVVRTGLNKDLDFSPSARSENIRRIGEVTKLFYEAGIIVMTAFISPFRSDRNTVRELLPPGGFVEIYVHCPIEICEERDPKGLYKKARLGGIPDFTGIGSPYEEPKNPEIVIESSKMSVEESVDIIIEYLRRNQIIR